MSDSDDLINIYAKVLTVHKLGHGLWVPEPSESFGEVAIGDVGYIEAGKFKRLFNCTLSPEDASHEELGTPPDYVPYSFSRGALDKTKAAIGDKELLSANVKRRGFKTEVSADATFAQAGAGGGFTSTAAEGAYLILTNTADHQQTNAGPKFIRYLRDNLEDWVSFGRNELDRPITLENIICIRSVVKTSQHWALGAFRRSSQEGELFLAVEGVPFLNLNVTYSNSSSGSWLERSRNSWQVAAIDSSRPSTSDSTAHVGTHADPETSASSIPSTSAGSSTSQLLDTADRSARRDQCLFVGYFAVKKRLGILQRLLPLRIRARAGPHEIQPGSDDEDDSGSAAISCDESSGSSGIDSDEIYTVGGSKPWHLLSPLLDFILEHSPAEYAIASDAHLMSLFPDQAVPNNVAEALKVLKPQVVVDDELGVGWVSTANWVEDDDAGPSEHAELINIPGHSDTRDADELQYVDSNDLGEGEKTKGEKRVGGLHTAVIILEEHKGPLTCAVFSPDGRFIATGAEDCTLVFRRGATGVPLETFRDHDDTVYCLKFSPDSTKLVSGSADGTMIIWDAARHARLATLDGNEAAIQTIAFSPNSAQLLTAGVDYTARIWDATTGVPLRDLAGHTEIITATAFSPNGTRVATCGTDQTSRLWNARTGDLVHTLEGHTDKVWALAFAPDGRRLVTGGEDRVCRVWSVDSGEELVVLREHGAPVWHVEFAPDGARVLSAARDGSIRLCDSFSGALVDTFQAGESAAGALALAPDGKRVAAPMDDNVIMVWECGRSAGGKQPLRLEGHSDKATSLQFSSDSLRLLSASDDGTARIWDLADYAAEMTVGKFKLGDM